MFSLKDYFFEVQFLFNIFTVSAIVILAVLYIKLAAEQKSDKLVEKIEYLCKNLKVLVEQSENSSDIIKRNIDEFKNLYDRNIAEIEKKASDIAEIMDKIERNENISDKLGDRDKYSKIKTMLNEGHSIDDIAKILKINKGEVELINNIIKKT